MKSILVCTFFALLAVAFGFSTDFTTYFTVQERRWYVGGKFASVKTAAGAKVEANNIAMWNGNSWDGMKNGTNGDVRVVTVDICRNVYAGGAFTTAGGVATGPIAVYSFTGKSWRSPFKSGHTVTWTGTSNVVRALSVDCVESTTVTNKCQYCDLYIGGQFVIRSGDGSYGYNVVKYDVANGWNMLKTTATQAVISSIYRKDVGSSATEKYLYVGSDASSTSTTGFTIFDMSSSNWMTDMNTAKLTGKVNALYYETYTTGTDKVFIGGEFTIATDACTPPSGLTQCQNIVYYNYKEKKYYQVGSDNIPSSVTALHKSKGANLFVVGNFITSKNSYRGVVSIDVDNTGAAFSNPGSVQFNPSTASSEGVVSVNVCGTADAGCNTNFFTYVTSDGALGFYDPKGNKASLANVTSIPNEKVYSVYSAWMSPASSVKVAYSFFAIVLLVVLALL